MTFPRILCGAFALAMSSPAFAVFPLTLTLADNHGYVRYGQTLSYVVTLTNDSGTAASGVPVSAALSPAWDADAASWVCYPGTDGAVCTDHGSGALNDTVTLPPGARVSWVLSLPTHADTADTTATVSVSATGAATISDTDTLVIFKEGFDVPYGDGTQALPSELE